jgi:hypothetical protein
MTDRPPPRSYAMQNDEQLVVKDGDDAVVIWTSAEEKGTSSAKQGWTYQITSNGRKDVACIHSGPTPDAVHMPPPQSKAFKLQIAQSGAALSVVGADGSKVWGPSGAKAGSPPRPAVHHHRRRAGAVGRRRRQQAVVQQLRQGGHQGRRLLRRWVEAGARPATAGPCSCRIRSAQLVGCGPCRLRRP